MVSQQTNAPLASENVSGPMLWRMITGCFLSQAIYVAAELGIADILEDGPKSISDLASITATHELSLHRLMRALASAEIFAETADNTFTLTPLANFLRQNAPNSLRAGARLIGTSLQWPTLGNLLYSVQSGECAFDHLFGMPLWEYTTKNPAESDIFQAAMSGFSEAEITAVLRAYDFSAFHTILDIAGGQGTFLGAILNRYPTLQGILFDMPHVVEGTEALFVDADIARRCTAVGGNMFESLPGGYDAYIMKTVIHDWDDQRAITLLTRCREAMLDHSKLLIVTRVIKSGNVPDASKFMDLNMMVTLGGCERTEADFNVLLNAAQLQIQNIIPTQSYLSILECVKS